MNKDELLDMAMEACEADDQIGYCIKCGAEHYGIEPDARKYECEECGKNTVCAAQEIVMMFGV